jgi:geranylgeranyl pyrophosphate synthase
MNVYESVVAYLLKDPSFQNWPELRTILERTGAMKPRDWKLPVRACEAVSGSIEQAIPASSAIACAQISIVLIDDMLDEDPRGEYLRVGAAQAANLSSAFQSLGGKAILESAALPKTKIAVLRTLNQMIAEVAYGQFLDTQNIFDETDYWRIVKSKSAPFFGVALQLGALFGEAAAEVTENIKQIGSLYGEMIQIPDDLNDTMAVPANPDWLQGRSPLPILFAKLADHPERSRFMELCQSITEEDALHEAQEILIHCGAVSYCVDQILRRHQAAQDILTTMSLPRREVLDALLEEVVAPVWELFDAVGVSQPRSVIPPGWVDQA